MNHVVYQPATAAAVTDGPFTETKECLAGFYMIEARPIRPIREAPNAHRKDKPAR